MHIVKPLYTCPAARTSFRYYILCHIIIFLLNIRVPAKHEGVTSLKLKKL